MSSMDDLMVRLGAVKASRDCYVADWNGGAKQGDSEKRRFYGSCYHRGAMKMLLFFLDTKE